MQVAHFLEADLQRWADALAATLFGGNDTGSPAAGTATEPLQTSSVSSTAAICAGSVAAAAAAGPPQPPNTASSSSSKAPPPGECAATGLDAAWRHLDALWPLGDASSVVLRAWRLPCLLYTSPSPRD